jgi:quercetin dioxygenase-like cupin family protein
MAQPTVTPAQIGDLNTLIYDFAKPGDILQMHNHDEETSHVIIVARGSVVILVQDPQNGGVNSEHHEAGAVIDTFAGFPHGIVGVAENSRTVHIRKHLTKSAGSEGKAGAAV